RVNRHGREVAPSSTVSNGALERVTAPRLLILRVERVVAHSLIGWERVDVLRQLVDQAVVYAIGEELVVRVGVLVVVQVTALVAELHALGSRDVRRGSAPRDGALQVPPVRA